MKHIIILTTLILFSALLNAEEDKNIDLIVKENSTSIKGDRTANYIIEAFYLSIENIIHIHCSGTKETKLYILNTYGDIINSSSSYCGDIESSIQLDVPDIKGKYFIVIESPVAYAYGTFSIIK